MLLCLPSVQRHLPHNFEERNLRLSSISKSNAIKREICAAMTVARFNILSGPPSGRSITMGVLEV